MSKVFPPLLCACLFSACVFAQPDPAPLTATEIEQQPQHPALAAFSNCLKSAVDAERADTVSDASLDRVKTACRTEWAAVKQVLPQDIVEQLMALLDEGLRRELNR